MYLKIEGNTQQSNTTTLYVSKSESLITSMQRSFNAPMAQEIDSQAVQFKSYQQLINELVPETAQMSFMEKEHLVNIDGQEVGNLEIDEFLKKNNMVQSSPSKAGMFAQREEIKPMTESSNLQFK